MKKNGIPILWGLAFFCGAWSSVWATVGNINSVSNAHGMAQDGTFDSSDNGYQGSFINFTGGNSIRGTVIFKQGFQVPSNGAVFYDADGPIFDRIELGNSSSVLQKSIASK